MYVCVCVCERKQKTEGNRKCMLLIQRLDEITAPSKKKKCNSRICKRKNQN